jgi:hypothetical protein
MLMPEIAAFGEAAHVENPPAVGNEQMRTSPADDDRSIPLRLPAPAM